MRGLPSGAARSFQRVRPDRTGANTTQGDVHCKFWLPEEGLADKARNDRVPYDIWAKQGWLNTTPVRLSSMDLSPGSCGAFLISVTSGRWRFDRYNMRFLRPHLIDAGFTDVELERFVEFGRGLFPCRLRSGSWKPNCSVRS